MRAAFICLLATLGGCALSDAMRPEAPSIDCASATPAGGDDESISWYSPGRDADRRTLADWCRTVGPPVVFSEPDPIYGSFDSSDSLLVLTWNGNVGNGDPIAFTEAELGIACREIGPKIIGPFNHFVLLFQEANRGSEAIPFTPKGPTIPPGISRRQRPGAWLDISEFAERCGFSLIYVPSARNGFEEIDGLREDKGNAVLSSLALTDFVAIDLPFEAARKVAVGASVVGFGGQRIRAVSVHFDVTSTLFRLFATGNSSRARQGRALVNSLAVAEGVGAGAAGAAGAGNPVAALSDDGGALTTLIGGDFNTWSADETVLQVLSAAFPDSPPRDPTGTRGGFPTDHIFVRTHPAGSIGPDLGSYRTLRRSYFSDHLARSIRLRSH